MVVVWIESIGKICLSTATLESTTFENYSHTGRFRGGANPAWIPFNSPLHKGELKGVKIQRQASIEASPLVSQNDFA
jgi:hypothetical protein